MFVYLGITQNGSITTIVIRETTLIDRENKFQQKKYTFADVGERDIKTRECLANGQPAIQTHASTQMTTPR